MERRSDETTPFLNIKIRSENNVVPFLLDNAIFCRLKLVRYVHGLKFEQLQQAIASSNANSPTGQLVLGTTASRYEHFLNTRL